MKLRCRQCQNEDYFVIKCDYDVTQYGVETRVDLITNDGSWEDTQDYLDYSQNDSETHDRLTIYYYACESCRSQNLIDEDTNENPNDVLRRQEEMRRAQVRESINRVSAQNVNNSNQYEVAKGKIYMFKQKIEKIKEGDK